MALIQRANLPAADLPSEEVDCPSLGGSFIVRGLDMPGMLYWSAERRRLSTPQAGETDEAARQRAGAQLIPLLLALAVHLEDGPAYARDQWAALGARHPEDAMRLFQAALRLAGQDADAEKKT